MENCPNVLTAQETRRLLKVKTSPREAKQMIRRFTEALKMMDNNDYYPRNGDVLACPHCVTAFRKLDQVWPLRSFNCKQCAYSSALSEEERKRAKELFCIKRYTFGGVTYKSIKKYVELARDDIRIIVPMPKKTDEKVRTFCHGHIQWGNLVLQQKSVVPQKGKEK